MRARLPLVIFLAALVLAPLAYGTVHPLPTLVFELTGYALFAYCAHQERARTGSWAHVRDPLIVIGLLGVAWGGFQLAPLPPDLLALVAPGTYELTHATAQRLGLEAPGWRAAAVSVWPVEKAMLYLLALVAWYGAARIVLQDRPAANAAVRTLACAASAIGLLALAQSFTGATQIFWVGLARDGFYGPLVNPNNTAGLLVLGTLAGLAAAHIGRRTSRSLWLAAAALSATACVLSLSRGGTLVLAFALLLTAVTARGLRRGGAGASPMPALALTVATLGAVAWLGATEVVGELATLQNDQGTLNGRTAVWARGLTGLLPAHPLFGVGYGNFADVYPVYDARPAEFRIPAAENEYLHALFEGGVVGGVLAVAALAVVVGRLAYNLRAARRVGTAVPLSAGLAALLVHMALDFPLHLGGPALWIITATALVARQAERPATASAASKPSDAATA